MVLARKYVVTKKYEGLPKKSDYEIVTYELPPLKNGEVLVKTEWISVDPYLWGFQLPHIPYDQFGYQVALVQESKNPKFPVGTRVVTHKGWSDYAITSESEETILNILPLTKLPKLDGLPDSLGVGACGMPGATAYFGFLEICKPKPGETVVVTGAAGAVGSLVGQIAKIKGCKVIGFAGSDKKVEWLEKELGFDKAYNYKTVKTLTALAEAAPNGVDCFFDNVGGETFAEVISRMNEYGRVSMCGSINDYRKDEKKGNITTDVRELIMIKQLKLEGFIVTQWIDRWDSAFEEMAKWIKDGQLKVPEHVTEGFQNIYEALIGMLTGDNFGKAVVKV